MQPGKVVFKANASYLTTMDEQHTTADLVSFGNYLLSKERKKNLVNPTNKRSVTDADLANWKQLQKDNTKDQE